MKLTLIFALSTALAILGCSASPETVTSGSVDQIRGAFGTFDGSQVIILVVDDAPTAEAATMRAGVVAALRTTLRSQMARAQPYDEALADPAAWHSVDLRVVVARPSAARSMRLVGPSDDARLSWIRTNASASDVDAVADAVVAAIEGGVAPAGVPFRPLDAANHAFRLAVGDTPPADGHESALVASLGGRHGAYGVLVATTRDDEGAGAEDLELPQTIAGVLVGTDASLLTTVALPSSDCSGSAWGLTDATRVERWARANVASVTPWTCLVGALGNRTLFPNPWIVDYGEDCFSNPVARLPTGAEACRVTWRRAGPVGCDDARGWLDPVGTDGVRHPSLVPNANGSVDTVCELRALTGDASSACRTTMACEGCGAGWCHTEVVALKDPYCADPRLGMRLRFVGGAAPWGDGVLDVTCDLAR